MLFEDDVIGTFTDRDSVVFAICDDALVVAFLNFKVVVCLVIFLSRNQINTTFGSNQYLGVPNGILEFNRQMEFDFVWIFNCEVSSLHESKIIFKELDKWNCTVSTGNNDVFWSNSNCEFSSIKLAHVYENLLGCYCGKGSIKCKIVSVQCILFYSEALQTIRGLSEVPGQDLSISCVRLSTCGKEC